MQTSTERTDKRTLSDRRKRPAAFMTRYDLWGGRRKTIRRDKDRSTHYHVDLYSPRLFLVFITLIVLSLIDSYFTLVLISHHSIIEANPIMDFYLGFGDAPFILVKIALTAASLIILCLYRNLFVTKAVLSTTIVMYILIILYEVRLLNTFSAGL